jgi:hypothetical protein
MTTRRFGSGFVMVSSLVVCLGAAATGCVAHSDLMTHVAAPTAIQAPADGALVVFVRHSRYGGAVMFTVIDEHGKFIGVSQGNSHFAAVMAPGHHVFISGTANNTSAVDATLAAGKVYFVEVSARPGAFTAAPELHALKPSSEGWKDREGWLKETDTYTADIAKGQADLDDQSDRIKDGLEAWRGYDANDKKDRSLVETDGI